MNKNGKKLPGNRRIFKINNIHNTHNLTGMRKIIIACAAFFLLLFTVMCSKPKSADAEYERRADSLLALMTLQEKIGQLTLLTSDWDVTGPSMNKNYLQLIKEGRIGGLFNAYSVDYVRKIQQVAVEQTRLHIPLLFGYDVIHGHRTIFPIPLAQACSWNIEAIEKSDSIAAAEASAEGINWVYAPMLDISRDCRWGRVAEGPGEDTWWACQIAGARVRGFQGNGWNGNNKVLACVKHFAAYGLPQAGRDYHTVDMSDRTLYEWYLPSYKAAVDAGAASVMTSFNEIGGVPSTCNQWLLNDLLRNQWGFNGFVVTDYTAINELMNHGVAADSAHAGEIAINAGVDMDMQGEIYLHFLEKLVEQKKVSVETIDKAVKNILVAKFKLGLFENPYKFCDKKREAEDIMRPGYLSFARNFAAQSCVLLKNNKQTLPIPNSVKTIAIIGPLADSKADMLGTWSAAGNWDKCVSLLEGMQKTLPEQMKLMYAKGCEVEGDNTGEIKKAVALAKQADYVVLALGENRDMTGEAASRANIGLPGVQMLLAREIIKTGKPVTVVLFNGRPLVITELDSIAPAILEAWHGGTQAGYGVADVLWGRYNPSGKLAMTFPRCEGQIPIFYNCKNTGRPVDPSEPNLKYKSRYLDIPNAPLYPFGFGLSYTQFAYSEIKLNKPGFVQGDTIVASVDVKNTGAVDGTEVVQLYVHDVVGDVTRPVKELKGISKIFLKAGESKTVKFKLSLNELSYYHKNMSFTWDPGDFELFIGTSSADNRRAAFTVK
jgi:beta-glucosidase